MDEHKEHILIIKLGALGDFVQALGPMRAIREHHPKATITLLTTNAFVTFGTQSGYANHVWVDEKLKWFEIKKWFEFKKKLNEANFSRVYDLQNNDRTSIYFRLFHPKPEWVGVVKGASHQNNSPKRTEGKAFDGHVQTLKLAGINTVNIDDMSWIKGSLDHFKLPNPYILLVPGSSPGRPEKQWPEDSFGALARTVYGWGFTPVILGTKYETQIAKKICDVFPKAVDITGETALSDIALLAKSSSAAIGNDTGPMHIIAQSGCPSYVFFSKESDPTRHAPIGPFVKTFKSDNLANLKVDKVIEEISVRDFRTEF